MTAATRRSDAAALLLLILLTTIFFADVLFGSGRFFIRDLTRYYFPTKWIIREVILGGEFPYWNPYYSAGQPMAANPEYEVFYPLQLLILLPDYDLGFRLHILVHYYIVTSGMYVLLRSMGLGIAGSLFGSISTGLGGLYMSLGNLLPILFAAAWMPWIFLAARRLFLSPRLGDFAWAALLMGIQGLVGEPTTMLQTWFLIGAYALYRTWSEQRPRGRVFIRNITLAGLLVMAGMATAAAQILPAFDHVSDSARSRPFTFELVTAWSMPYVRPLELLAPNLFGYIYREGTWFWGGGTYPGVGSPFLFSLYLGLLPALLLIAACFIRQRGAYLVLLILIVAIMLALGKNTPLYRWLYDAEVATTVRYPEKFIFMGLFACAVLAAILFDRLAGGDSGVLKIALIAALAVFAATLAVAVFSSTSMYERVFRDLWGVQKSPNAPRLIELSRADWWVATARSGVAALLVAMGFVVNQTIGGRMRTAWVTLLLAFLAVDLAPTQFNVLPRVHKRFFTEPAIARTLDPDRAGYRIFHEADWYGSSEVARRFFGTGDAVYWVVRNGLFPMTPGAWKFRTVLERDYDKTQLHPTIDLTDAVWQLKNAGRKDWREIAMAMSGARYHTQYRDFESERMRVAGRFKVSQPVDFIRGEDNRRFYFAEELIPIRDRKDLIAKLKGGKFSRAAAFVHFPVFAPGRGQIRNIREAANTIRLEVEAESRSFLVLSVTPHKYWRARLDGKPVVLQRANIGYQGVVIPPGQHTLEMRYRNSLVPIGVTITAAATLCFLLIGITGSLLK